LLKSGTAELAIAGPLDEAWSRLDEFPLFGERFCLVVSRTHRLADKGEADFKDIASENLLINAGCEMVEELRACLEANGILDRATHQVSTQEDVLALLRADMGVAILPSGATEVDGVCFVPLKRLNLARRVSVYAVAGRQRGIACATLLNMLRAAEWGFDTGTKQLRKAYR
jgi:DNA-binding transcriptional LysR family regulator